MSKHSSSYRNDIELIRAVLAQEPAAEEEFFALVWKIVNAHAHSWGVPACDAEDLASEVVTKALERLPCFNAKRAKLITWIFVIGRNHAYDQLRRGKNDPLRQESIQLQDWMELSHDTAEPADDGELFFRPEIFRRLDEALKQLDSGERQLLQLSIESYQTAPEIARVMGMTPGQVRVRKHRLLIRLRDLLA